MVSYLVIELFHTYPRSIQASYISYFLIISLNWFDIGNLGTRFHITKYPTLKYVRNGQLAKREYRGQRSADAFLQFVKEQTKDPIKEFKELKELTEMDGKKRYIIGYFEDKNSLEYANFRKSAMNLKDDCVFHAGFGEVKLT